MTYLLTVLLITGGLIFNLTSCKSKKSSTPADSQSAQTKDTAKSYTLSDNHYQDLRNMALAVTPEQLQLSIPEDQTKVFGVVMDWDLAEGVATFISFETGDASMYLSSGGGMIGGSGHEKVSTAAKSYVSEAQKYLANATKIESTPSPDKDCVRFYFLTNKGRFSVQEKLKNLENKSSRWLPLFEEANKVISELRVIEENR